MNYVKRAIIMAAGIGSRLRPVTSDVPKPLVRVNGTRMIDTILQGLHNNGITEIYVVVGYLKEQFSVLLRDYENIHLLENPYYDTCNNISSLYVARDHIDDALILDGDQMIYNDSILSPEFEKSGYNAIWTEEPTDEWLMTVENGSVVSCSRDGGEKGWQLFSISRWSQEDGLKLKKQVELEFEKKQNRQIYWDDVPMFLYAGEYDLGIHPMKAGDVVEIDNYEELVAMDGSYTNYTPKGREDNEN